MTTPMPISAHDHGNCELCDQIERELAEARASMLVKDTEWMTRAINAEAKRDALNAEFDKFKEEREGNTRQFRRLQRSLAQAESDCGYWRDRAIKAEDDAFKMAAGQCCVKSGGLMADDHGHTYCDMQRQRDELLHERSIETLAFEQVKAERDALKADAERYRWLKAENSSMESWRASVRIALDAYTEETGHQGDELDAAIDAAMKEDKA